MYLSVLRQNPAVPDQLKSCLDYIEQLASMTGENISNWDIPEVFKDARIEKKREINKKFFSHVEALKGNAAPEVVIPPGVMECYAGSIDRNRLSRIEELNGSLTYCQERIGSRLREVDDLQRQATRALNDIAAMRDVNAPIAPERLEEFKKLFSHTFWQFECIHNHAEGCLYFKTTQDVIMVEHHPTLGQINRTNLGTFRAEVRLNSGNIYLKKLANNVTAGSRYYHPYVNHNGDICWGNASDLAHSHMQCGRWFEALDLLASLLVTYDRGSTPWIDLYSLHQQYLVNTRSRDSQAALSSAANSVGLTYEQARQSEERVWRYCDLHLTRRSECSCGDWCSTCDRSWVECGCYTCDICNLRSIRPCPSHWCERCEDYYDDPTDHCNSCDNHVGSSAHEDYCEGEIDEDGETF